MSTLDKTYDPHAIEEKWYQWWLDHGYFHPDPTDEGEPYCIVIPPPNVTGILHMGHALNNTIQDVLVRCKRMQGYNAVWIPGTDHASIATEGKVVQRLRERGIDKQEIGRDDFLKHAWEWKEEFGGIILNQLKRLGFSCDWERLNFTMDDDYAKAVLHAFVELYNKGLVYRGKRLVNWCPASRSAISDEEVVHKEVDGSLWHFNYPVVDSEEMLVVATTRPETMLGDTGVAVHPDDDRYRHLHGKKIRLPLVNREIPIITDKLVDPEFGTGCVKVTPAHDPNDFEMGMRHKLAFINIMHPDASMNDEVPEAYRGLSREEARKKVVDDLEAEGLLAEVESYKNKVGYSQRGDVPIEYYLSEQWFMRMQELAKPALDVVRDGQVRIHPEHWVKTYNHWLEHICDWCISRQLWWGHRIPVWYKKGADRNDPDARHVSVDGPPDPENWEQEEDVLDTWASSWLWPMAVFGWPEKTPELDTYYPGGTLVTAPDIIFFWVARMIMAGCEFMGDVPFRDVYIHGIVRDDHGRKMSKSLGNSIDPLTVVEEYSADALRFSLLMIAATGTDIYLSVDKFEIGRNFATKIWNAARYLQMQTRDAEGTHQLQLDPAHLTPDDMHILVSLNRAVSDCTESLERFRFNDYAKTVYEFLWHQFCDWYIEYSKTYLYSENEARRTHVLNLMHYVFSSALKLLHPLMPFVTEELWHGMGYDGEEDALITAAWPEPLAEEQLRSWGVTADHVDYVEGKHEVIRLGRMMMADYGLLPKHKVTFIIKPDADAKGRDLLQEDKLSVQALLKAADIQIDPAFSPDHAMPSEIAPLGAMYMPVEGLIDVEAELTKLNGQLKEIQTGLQTVEKKLSNEKFVNKAPAEVVEQQRQRKTEMLEKMQKIDKLITALKQS